VPRALSCARHRRPVCRGRRYLLDTCVSCPDRGQLRGIDIDDPSQFVAVGPSGQVNERRKPAVGRKRQTLDQLLISFDEVSSSGL
jgi:hypothetical protein